MGSKVMGLQWGLCKCALWLLAEERGISNWGHWDKRPGRLVEDLGCDLWSSTHWELQKGVHYDSRMQSLQSLDHHPVLNSGSRQRVSFWGCWLRQVSLSLRPVFSVQWGGPVGRCVLHDPALRLNYTWLRLEQSDQSFWKFRIGTRYLPHLSWEDVWTQGLLGCMCQESVKGERGMGASGIWGAVV